MHANHRTRVAVLMGGIGGERTVSLKSGRAVVKGLQEAGYDVLPYEVNDTSLPGLQSLDPDVVFVALHGRFGEDGTVQELLEAMRLPYTGSGPEASRRGMDKVASKRLFVRHSVPTADYFAVSPTQQADAAVKQADQLGWPVVCKPACAGSSLGVSIVREAARMKAALEGARQHSATVLVERYVPAREFTAGVLDGEALPVIELIVPDEFFDYDAKYTDERTRYVTPVALLPTVYRRIVDVSLRAYHATGCRHVARVDVLYGHDATLNVLEVNTIPGLTPRSLLPMAAAQVGISFPELCHRTVQAALRDAREDARLRRRTA